MAPRLLDLYCGAGGAAVGYHRAGFEVVGVDVEPQPRYPYRFIRADALEILAQPNLLRSFAAIHASPPCKVHTALKPFAAKHHTDLVGPTRDLLARTGLPTIIENVPGAPMRNPVILCGSMFGLGVRRHRLFELGGWDVGFEPPCDHAGQNAASPGYPTRRYHSGKPVIARSPVIGVFGRGQGLGEGEGALQREAMGIGWMVRDELSQAIPPAYTAWLGRALLEHLSTAKPTREERG